MDSYIDKIEVHVGIICFLDNKCLALKRSPTRRLYPGLWECGGGKVHKGETFEDACVRQMKEEAGIDIKNFSPLSTYHIDIPNEDQKVIPGIKFVAEIIDFKKVTISDEHTEYKFVDESELSSLEFIPGIDDDIRKGFDILRK